MIRHELRLPGYRLTGGQILTAPAAPDPLLLILSAGIGGWVDISAAGCLWGWNCRTQRWRYDREPAADPAVTALILGAIAAWLAPPAWAWERRKVETSPPIESPHAAARPLRRRREPENLPLPLDEEAPGS